MKQQLSLFVLLLWLSSCQDPIVRKPIHQSNDHAMRASVQRNREILKSQQQLINRAIQSDSLYRYESSPAGYWFARLNPSSSPKPVTGDEVTFSFEIQTLSGEIIYPKEELGTVNYLVDKEELLPALRYAVKNLGQNEKGIFLVPSYLGYGYQGDGEKIGINQPLRFTIELLKLEKN